MPDPFQPEISAAVQPRPEDVSFDLDEVLSSVVSLTSQVPLDAHSASTLGPERQGNGVLIRDDGLVLTVGYLITEAETIWLVGNNGKVAPAHAVGSDQATGFGLVQALQPLDLPPIELGSSAGLSVGERVIVAGHGGRPLGAGLGRWLAWSGAFAVVAYAAWLPFHASYDAPLRAIVASEWRTVLWHYLGIHALLILLVGTWVAVEAYRRLGAARGMAIAVGVAAAAVAALVWWLAEALRPWTTAVLLGVLLATAVVLWGWWAVHRREAQAPVQMLLVGMAVLAIGIGIGVDVVTVRPDIDRMNTVFRLFLNAWVLFSIVGGVGLWHLWATGGLRWRGGGWTRYGRRAWLAVLAVLVLASAVFPVVGTRARLVYRFDTSVGLTLDGAAYQQVAVYGDPAQTDRQADDRRYALRDDAEALEFMRQNIPGSPVVLEGATRHAYRWQPRVAAYTGLPVVVGWQWHQLQQRGESGNEPANVLRRVRHVEEMYATEDTRRLMELLETYEVAYVYVGPAERTNFPEGGIAKFAAMGDEGLELFFANDAVQVYRVAGRVR